MLSEILPAGGLDDIAEHLSLEGYIYIGLIGAAYFLI